MSRQELDFEVALSFAGEERPYVEAVADGLAQAGVACFYDDDHRAELWGQDLAIQLDNVYRKRAHLVVVFVSAAYAAKIWPQHEFRSALAAALEAQDTVLLPVRFDETELPGLRPTIAFVDARTTSPEQLVGLILRKMGRAPTGRGPGPAEGQANAPAAVPMPRLAPKDFNPYAEAEKTYAFLKAGLTERATKLSSAGLVGHAFEREGRFRLQVLREGELLFGLDIWLGGDGLGGDETLSFHHGWHERITPGSVTGTGRMVWDKERGAIVVEVWSLSIISGGTGTYRMSRQDLLEALWQSVIQHLEAHGG